MSFYNYGQNVSSGLGDLLSGGEEGYTFGQGVRSMLQKRKLDAQAANDKHTTAQIDDRYKMKEGGFGYAPPSSPTTGGGPISPLDDPSNGPRQADGATEIGATTPLASGVSNPTPKPGLFGKIGALLHLGGGQSHSDTGNNAGSHTTDQFTDTGKMLTERVNDATQGAETDRSNAVQKATTDRQGELLGFEGWNSEANRANQIKIHRMDDDAKIREHSMSKGDALQSTRINALQHQMHSLDSRLSGMWGAPTLSEQDKAQLMSERRALQMQLEREMQLKPGTLQASSADPSEAAGTGGGFMGGAVNPNATVPQALSGGKYPSADDQVWQQALRDAGIIK